MYLPYKHAGVSDAKHFYVVAVVSNPVRYRSRYELYRRFKRSMECAGVKLMTVELALGNRSFEVTRSDDSLNVQLRTYDELWHKENLINLGISRLPADWQYVAWVDADVEFLRQDWAEETVHQLQRYQIVQMFTDALDMGPNGELLQSHKGFAHSWLQDVPSGPSTMGYYGTGQGGVFYHPGYGWAARREAIDALGGLFDGAVLGASDHHMAWSLIGQVEKSTPGYLSKGYMDALYEWQRRATDHIKGDIGAVPGAIQHHFHGPKTRRFYQERWEIIKKWDFDPALDLKKDWQGLYAFTSRGERMRNDLRSYFNARMEDDIRAD